jgi:hypothetical protein
MLEGEGIVNGAAKEPLQKLVVEWLVDVFSNIPGQMVPVLNYLQGLF